MKHITTLATIAAVILLACLSVRLAIVRMEQTEEGGPNPLPVPVPNLYVDYPAINPRNAAKLAARNVKRFKSDAERKMWEQMTEHEKAIDEAHAAGDNDEFMRLGMMETDPIEESLERLRKEHGPGWIPKSNSEGIRDEVKRWITDPKGQEAIEAFVAAQKDPYDSYMSSKLQAHLIEKFGREWWNQEAILLGWSGSQARSFSAEHPITKDQTILLARESEAFRDSPHAYKITEEELMGLSDLRARLEVILGQKTDDLWYWKRLIWPGGLFPVKIDFSFPGPPIDGKSPPPPGTRKFTGPPAPNLPL